MVNIENGEVNTVLQGGEGPDFSSGTTYAQFDYSSESTNARDVKMGPDGAKLWILDGTADFMYEYSMDVPYDVSTATLSATADLTGSSLNDGYAFTWNSQGRDLVFMEGEDRVVRLDGGDGYNLSEFDGNTDNNEYSINGDPQNTRSRGILSFPDRDEIVIVNGERDDLLEYQKPSSVDDSTNNWQNNEDINGDGEAIDASWEYVNGTRYPDGLYVLYDSGDIKHFDVPNNGNISDVGGNDNGVVANTVDDFGVSGINSLDFGMSNRALILQNSSANLLYSVDVSQGYLPSTSSSESFDASTEASDLQGIYVDESGETMYTVGETNADVYQYALSTPYDVSSASLSHTLDVSGQDSAPTGVHVSPDGDALFITGSASDTIYQYTIGTVGDISTATPNGTLNVASADTSPEDLFIRADGEELLMVGSQNASIYDYDLSTPFDVTTASLQNTVDVSGEDTSPKGIFFDNAGEKVYVAGSTESKIFEYSNLSYGNGLNYITFSKELDVANEDTSPSGIVMSNNESELYVAGGTNTSVYAYEGNARAFTPESGSAYKITAYSSGDITIGEEVFSSGEVEAIITEDDRVTGDGALINGYRVK